jgi:hypothetical protein
LEKEIHFGCFLKRRRKVDRSSRTPLSSREREKKDEEQILVTFVILTIQITRLPKVNQIINTQKYTPG